MAVWGSLLLIAIIFGFVSDRLTPLSVATILALGISFYYSFRTRFALISLLLSLGVLFHVLPGFQNLLVLDNAKLTSDAIPYTLYFNFDKPLIGLFILAFGWSFVNERSLTIKTMLNTLFIVVLALICMPIISLLLNYVRFEPKWNNFIYVFAVNNLIFTCIAEEALFRGLIQQGLSKRMHSLKYGKILALCIAALFFGVAHFRGGWPYVLLATVAGLFYGAAYLRTKRLEASIACHFLVNLTHMIFFTYPALATSPT